MKWISVKEKMPTHNKGVLVFIPDEDFHITSGMWDISNKWVLLDEYRIPDCEITHWMNMPEIPKEFIKDRNESNEILKTLSVLLKEGKISLNSNEPGAVSSHESEKDFIGCTCTDEEKHGETSIMCCNHCGKPTESFWVNQ